VIVDPPGWGILLLDIGSGALIALAVYYFFNWRDRRR